MKECIWNLPGPYRIRASTMQLSEWLCTPTWRRAGAITWSSAVLHTMPLCKQSWKLQACIKKQQAAHAHVHAIIDTMQMHAWHACNLRSYKQFLSMHAHARQEIMHACHHIHACHAITCMPCNHTNLTLQSCQSRYFQPIPWHACQARHGFMHAQHFDSSSFSRQIRKIYI